MWPKKVDDPGLRHPEVTPNSPLCSVIGPEAKRDVKYLRSMQVDIQSFIQLTLGSPQTKKKKSHVG